MTKVIVWVLFVFHGHGGLPSAGIFTYPTKAECEANAGTFKSYTCVRVEVPKK